MTKHKVVAYTAGMSSSSDIAHLLLDVMPRTNWVLRAAVRKQARDQISVPQFRVLDQLSRGFNGTSKLAELHGISVPAMSNIVDGLVRRGLIARKASVQDRRQIELRLTEKGKALFLKLHQTVLETLTDLLDILSDRERAEMARGLEIWGKALATRSEER